MGVPVLVLDGDPDECAILMEHLHQHGYEPVGVGLVQQARRALETRHFDLLLLESILPDGSGLQYCNEIRDRLGPRPVIIFVSSDSRRSSRVAALELGADDYVVKPCDAEELLARIKAKLRRQHTNTFD